MIKNCVKIDINEIREGINCYRNNNKGEYPNYLIMNEKTLSLLDNDMSFDRGFAKFWGMENYASFWDIPIAICNKFKLGEIDII